MEVTEVSTVSHVQGFIDALDAGRVRGWVYDPHAHSGPAHFYVALDGKIITQGIADQYRQDLEQAGFGSGFCSFSISFPLPFSNVVGKKLTLLDKNGRLIEGAVLDITSELPHVEFALLGVTKHELEFVYKGKVAINSSIIASVDGTPIASLDTALIEGGEQRFSIALPNHLECNEECMLQLSVVGFPCVVWQEKTKLTTVIGNTSQVPTLPPLQIRSTEYELEQIKSKADSNTIVMIDIQTPTPDSDAGSYAAVEEIKLIQKLGYHVVFVPLTFNFQQKYTTDLEALGVDVCYSPNYASIEQALSEALIEASAVYITRYNVAFQCLDFIKQHAPSLPILFNNADLHFLREIRSALLVPSDTESNKNIRAERLQKALDTKYKELAIMSKVDVILSYNESEHAVITSHLLEQDKIFSCPWVLHDKQAKCQFGSGSGIAFLGGYKHLPNVEAVEYFFESVFPKLFATDPTITIHIYGSHMPESFKRFEHPNVELVGFVENLDDVYLRHRIFIAPLLSGAGIKGKVLESTAYGIPSVLSPVAAESTGLVHQTSTLVAQTPEQWVDEITTLYHDEALWARLAQNALNLASERYSVNCGLQKMGAAFRYVGLQVC